MTEKEKQLLDSFAVIISNMPEQAKDKLLIYGEGMAYMLELMRSRDEPSTKTA